jgi:CheY-like chemotaxis protein
LARTVLLADDSVTAQNMGRRILMDAGYEVITVNNGSAALKKIHESKPDLIVLDVYMPGYGGLEVCQRLKESAETMKIPVLLTVGKMEPFKPDEAKRVRADAHIVKPFDASELLAALTRLEDRIVPADGRGNGKSKKARFWHSEDPAKNFDDSSTEQIAYLAEVKKRQVRTEPVAAEVSHAAEQLSAGATTVEEKESSHASEGATLATAPAPVEPPTFFAEPAPEFQVERESALEFPAEPASAIEPSPVEPAQTDPVATSVVEPAPAAENKSRWVAESVTVTAEEASLELEREMQAAQSVAASAEVPVKSMTDEPKTDEPMTDEPTTDEPTTNDESVASVQEFAAPEASPSPESAGEQFSSSTEPAVSAFAAAASAGTPAIAESTSVVADPVPEPPVASEAAAAWENWQHIRETVMAPQNTAALAASVAEIAQASLPAPVIESAQELSEPRLADESQPSSGSGAPPSTEGQGGSVDSAEGSPQTSADASFEGESLSSIVDSVLAELKPRLMEQIAKKLKSEKK